MDNIKEVLKNIVIFHGLTEDELDLLVKKVEIRKIPANEVICEENELGKEMFFIISGKVDVLKRDKEKNYHKLVELHSGDSFGEMTLIDIQKRSATVRTIEPATVGILSNRSIFDIYCDNLGMYSKIILNIAREFSRRLRKMDKKLVEFAVFLEKN